MSNETEHNLPVVETPEEPIANPGLHEHEWRPTDVDEQAEKRAERQVAGMFLLSMLCGVLFIVAYFSLRIGADWDTFAGMGAQNLALGLSLGFGLLLIGVGIIHWARKLMSDEELVEYRHSAASTEDDKAAAIAALQAGAEESGIARRPLIRNTMFGALGMVGAVSVVAFRDLGPTPWQIDNAAAGTGLEWTVWKPGMRVSRDVTGTWIRPEDLQVGDLVNAEPSILFETDEDGEHKFHGESLLIAKTKAPVILLRMEPDDIVRAPKKENWDVNGIVAYSKICTHVGCPIALNERTTHHLLCPCHQSTFDLADSGRVVFGPANRALPQLPLAVDSEGFLVAQSDFLEPVGPSYWERNSTASYEEERMKNLKGDAK